MRWPVKLKSIYLFIYLLIHLRASDNTKKHDFDWVPGTANLWTPIVVSLLPHFISRRWQLLETTSTVDD